MNTSEQIGNFSLDICNLAQPDDRSIKTGVTTRASMLQQIDRLKQQGYASSCVFHNGGNISVAMTYAGPCPVYGTETKMNVVGKFIVDPKACALTFQFEKRVTFKEHGKWTQR